MLVYCSHRCPTLQSLWSEARRSSGDEEISARYVADIHDSLNVVAVASRSSKPIGDRMILNAAFLVDRAREQSFDECVKETSRKYEDQLTFKYSGPWPPYNFVNIKLKLEKAD